MHKYIMPLASCSRQLQRGIRGLLTSSTFTTVSFNAIRPFSTGSGPGYEKMTITQLKKALHAAKVSYADCKDRDSLVQRAKTITSGGSSMPMPPQQRVKPGSASSTTEQQKHTGPTDQEDEFQKNQTRFMQAIMSDPELMMHLKSPAIQKIMMKVTTGIRINECIPRSSYTSNQNLIILMNRWIN